MKRKLYIIIILWISCFIYNPLYSQEMMGVVNDNFLPIQQGILNPASRVSSGSQLQIQFGGADVFFQNNYVFIPSGSVFDYISRTADGQELESNTVDNRREGAIQEGDFLLNDRYTTLPKTVDLSLRVIGPGFYCRIRRNAFSLHTQVRAQVTARDMHYSFAKYGFEGVRFRPQHFQDFDVRGGQVHAMLWREINLGFSRLLINEFYRKLSVGITLKHLTGYEAVYFHNNRLVNNAVEHPENIRHVDLEVSEINLKYGHTGVTDNSRYPFVDPGNGSGVGIDFGIEMILKGAETRKNLTIQNRYILKAGLSFLDLGSVNFKNNTGTFAYEGNSGTWARFDSLKFEGITEFDTQMSQNFYDDPTASKTGDAFKMILPGAISAQFDWSPVPGFFIKANIIQRLPIADDNQARLIRTNHFSITPRYENLFLSLAFPFVIHDWNKSYFGASIRIWSLYFGTDDFRSWIFPHEFSGTNIYGGVSFTLPSKYGEDPGNRYYRTNKKLRRNRCYYRRGIFGWLYRGW